LGGGRERKHKRRTRTRSDTYKNLPSRKRTPQETKDRSHTQTLQNKGMNETETIAQKSEYQSGKVGQRESRETEKRREIAGDGGGSGREQKRTTTAAGNPASVVGLVWSRMEATETLDIGLKRIRRSNCLHSYQCPPGDLLASLSQSLISAASDNECPSVSLDWVPA
jgi:hypothetical protein